MNMVKTMEQGWRPCYFTSGMELLCDLSHVNHLSPGLHKLQNKNQYPSLGNKTINIQNYKTN